MQPSKATLVEIKKDFTIKVLIKIDDKFFCQEKLSLRGVEVPAFASQKGKALHSYLTRVFQSVPFVAVKKYGKDALQRVSAEIFYLPGAKEVEEIVDKGHCLNQELLANRQAEPYDESKYQVDFSKETITVNGQEIELLTGNFKAEICMYINDCKQYLRAALDGKPVNMDRNEFDPTEEEFLIICGLKELKTMSMQLASLRPLDWEGN